MPKTPSPPKKPEGSASRQGSHPPRSLNNALHQAALGDSEEALVAAVQAGLIQPYNEDTSDLLAQDGGYETPTDDEAQPEAVTPVFQTPVRCSEPRKCPWAPKRKRRRKHRRARRRRRKRLLRQDK